ncbi:hypothetical protein BBJ28_00004725, partial [Nothophytophthora sp. Chile5]
MIAIQHPSGSNVRSRSDAARLATAAPHGIASTVEAIAHGSAIMAAKSRPNDAANALITRPTTAYIGAAVAGPDQAPRPSTLEEGYQNRSAVSDEERRKIRKALARRWSEPSSDGEGVDLLAASHLGLLVNYACIGFLNGLLPALVYPFFKLYLNMDGFQVSAAA